MRAGRVTRLQGEWRTGTVWVGGDEVPVLAMAGEACSFSWGSHSEGSVRLALAILRRFCHRDIAVDMACDFSREVLSELPQGDFSVEIDIVGWIARKVAAKGLEARKARRRREGSGCVRRPHGGCRNGAAR